MITLLQSGRGTSVSATATSPATVGTATYTIPMNTQAGSLLVIHTAATNHAHTSGQYENVSAVISVPGIGSWTLVAGNSWKEGTSTTGGNSAMSYAFNAPALSAGTVVSVTFSLTGSGITYDAVGEVAFYEFGGVNTVSPVDTAKSINPANPGIPTQNNITTTATDLVIVGYSGSDSNSGANTGYTLGIQMVAATFSEFQYILNQAAGTFTTAFGSGSQTHFGAYAAAFKAALVVSFPTSFGSIIGE